MDEIIIYANGQPCTTSRIVAEKFGKEHAKVIRAIKNLEIDIKTSEANFGVANYIDEQGKSRPQYVITRDGFSLLVMGFTGKEAMKFKLEFIKAFNQMEERLKAQVKALSPAEFLLQQAKVMVEQEKRLSSVETTLESLVRTKEQATRQLQEVERSTDTVPEETLRNKIRRIVNQYVHAKHVEYRAIWNLIYDRLYYRYHINLRAVNKYKNENGLDVAERLGHLDKIYAIVSQELIL